MDIHKNARTTPHSRMLMIERLRNGWMVIKVAQALGVDPGTVRKWRDRFAAEGEAGLADRSSRPHRSPDRLSKPDEEEPDEEEIVARDSLGRLVTAYSRAIDRRDFTLLRRLYDDGLHAIFGKACQRGFDLIFAERKAQ